MDALHSEPITEGFTLVELMIVIALSALVLAASSGTFQQMLTSDLRATAVRETYSAWQSLATSAITFGGATLVGQPDALSLYTGSQTQPYRQWSLPPDSQVYLNGQPFQCLSLNGDALPVLLATPHCQTPVVNSTQTLPEFTVSTQGSPQEVAHDG